MENLPFQKRTSDLENDECTLSKIENLPFQTEISSFDFENNLHPLLINTVLKKIFKYSSTVDLKNYRLVSKDWNFEAFLLLKKNEWKSPILFETVGQFNSFLKTFGPCPQNILNQNLDCGQILVPSDGEPEMFFHKILPIMSSITGLKVNINIQQERTFVAHEVFQHLAQTIQRFDVRFIKNDNISLTPDGVYPPTQLPSLPALTTVIIRMDGFVKYEDKIIVHPEYVPSVCFIPKGFKIFNSEHRMCVDLIQEFVTKSPLLSEIHIILSNHEIDSVLFFDDFDEHKSIRILTNLKTNELEKISHLRFAVSADEDIQNLLTLVKRGLNRLKYLCLEFVYLMDGLRLNSASGDEENLLEVLKCQKETLECFKLYSAEEWAGVIKMPAILPKLKFLKLTGHIIYETDGLDLNKRFPNLIEIDFTGGLGYFLSQFRVSGNGRPVIPCVHVKKLHLYNVIFQEFDDAVRRLSHYFPNVTEVKYHMNTGGYTDTPACSELWTMTNLEHLVLKVPLHLGPRMFSSVLKPFEFIGGMTEGEIQDGYEVTDLLARLKRFPNITWLTGLKSLKIKQRRRYGCPEGRDESEGWSWYTNNQKNITERLGYNILSNMANLEHFSSDLHYFSKESVAELKMKIVDFEPGRLIH